jgi:DNA polymerase-3 subunit chi
VTEVVEFYVLKGAAERQRWLLACRLAEKAYLADLRVVLLSDSREEAEAIDELLWTFDERSFVPHRLHPGTGGAAEKVAPPVEIAAASPGDAAAADAPTADLLVNLTNRTPEPIGRYARIAEIVDGDETRRRLGRERFKQYRDLKIRLETHQVDDDA